MSRPNLTTIEGFLFPQTFQKIAPKINNLVVHDTDIFVASFPKCGTTWTEEMVWLIANDLDYEMAKCKTLDERFPFLEFSGLGDFEKVRSENGIHLTEHWTDSVKVAEEQKHPRFIKTHLPWNLLPKEIQDGSKNPKIVYVTRNPKDACVSKYYHMKMLINHNLTLDEYCELYLADKVEYEPFWKNVKSYWSQRNRTNILFLSFEDMKKDLRSAIQKVALFLDKNLNDVQIAALAEHLSFENMKKNDSVNKNDKMDVFRKLNKAQGDGSFMRSGKVGGYKESMNEEMIKKFDLWIKNNAGDMMSLFEY